MKLTRKFGKWIIGIYDCRPSGTVHMRLDSPSGRSDYPIYYDSTGYIGWDYPEHIPQGRRILIDRWVRKNWKRLQDAKGT